MKSTRKTWYIVIGLVLSFYGANFIWNKSAMDNPRIVLSKKKSPTKSNHTENIAQLEKKKTSFRQQASSSPTLLPVKSETNHQAKKDYQEAVFDSGEQEKIKKDYQKKMKILENTFYSEATDSQWSSKIVSEVRDALKQSEVLRDATRNVECHSSMCRIEIIDDGSGNMNQSIFSFAQKLAGSLPNLIANNIDEPGDDATLVLYLSRDIKFSPK